MALSVAEIIRQLQQGRKYEDLKTNVSWDSLSVQERSTLLEQANNWQEETSGYELLRLLYAIAPKTEYRFRITTLTRVVIRKNVPVDKNSLLKKVKSDLDTWRDALARSHDKKQIDLYQTFNADYIWLCGYVYEENGEVNLARERYQAALAVYQNLGYQNGIQRATQKLDGLKNRKQDDASAVPLEVLQDRRTILQADIARLTEDVNKTEQQLGVKRNEIALEENKLESFKQQASKISAEVQNNQDNLIKLSKEVQEYEKKISILEDGLQFLVILPQVAVAPLWIEVVRMALDKGQIDSFTIQALERLALNCPQEALPLLAEIAARSPEPFKVDTDRVQSGIAQWFGLIAEARSLQEKDEILSAKKMVDAWDTFFSMTGNSGNHG